jgi:hypothetical protein
MRRDVKAAGNDRVGVAPRTGGPASAATFGLPSRAPLPVRTARPTAPPAPAGFIQHDVHASAVYLAGSKRLNSLHHEVEDAAEDGRANTVLWALRSS